MNASLGSLRRGDLRIRWEQVTHNFQPGILMMLTSTLASMAVLIQVQLEVRECGQVLTRVNVGEGGVKKGEPQNYLITTM